MAIQEGNVETKICKYCQSEIPKKAKICPHCRKKQGGGKLPIILGAVVLCILLLPMMDGGDSNSSNSSPSSGAKSSSQTSAATAESTNGAGESSAVPDEGGNTYASMTAYDVYKFMQDDEVLSYTLNDKASVFLKEHNDLFPAKGEIDEELVDYGIDAREILKNDAKFGNKLMYLPNLHANQIFEEEVEDGYYFTEINAVDYTDGQYYYIFYRGEVSGVFDGDVIDVYGLPLGRSSFDNTNGGQTITIILGGVKVTASE